MPDVILVRAVASQDEKEAESLERLVALTAKVNLTALDRTLEDCQRSMHKVAALACWSRLLRIRRAIEDLRSVLP